MKNRVHRGSSSRDSILATGAVDQAHLVSKHYPVGALRA
jgi:hypothetical protein